MLKRLLITSLAVFVFANLLTIQTCNACTIGVAAGRATADGRPLVWKSRDGFKLADNEVYFNTSYKYKFVTMCNAGKTQPRIGVNEKGLALANSNSNDLPGGKSGPDCGQLQQIALGTCATVEEFQKLLDKTNITGRRTRNNVAIFDVTGAAAIFEVAGNRYWKYDAADPNVAPDGYLLKTNFAFHGAAKNGLKGVYSADRYRRTTKLFEQFYADGKVTYKDILRTQMRDFSDENSKPIPVPFPGRVEPDSPFGYIDCESSICRSKTVAAGIIRGTLPGEDPRLCTEFVILGQPALTIAVPYWPVGKTPPEANGEKTAPLCDAAKKIRTILFDYKNPNYINTYKLRNEKGNGLWATTFPAENKMLAEVEEKMAKWRKSGPDIDEMLATEKKFAAQTLDLLKKTCEKLNSWTPDKGK